MFFHEEIFPTFRRFIMKKTKNKFTSGVNYEDSATLARQH